MIKNTLTTIEDKIRTGNSIPEENRTELLTLLATLQAEVEVLSQTERESAESITGFTQISTHEATRQEKNQQLLQLSLDGLASSVRELETSHPKLAETVNSLCQILSNMGI